MQDFENISSIFCDAKYRMVNYNFFKKYCNTFMNTVQYCRRKVDGLQVPLTVLTWTVLLVALTFNMATWYYVADDTGGMKNCK